MMDVCRDISIGWPRRSATRQGACEREKEKARAGLPRVLELTHHPHVIDPSCTLGVTTNP